MKPSYKPDRVVIVLYRRAHAWLRCVQHSGDVTLKELVSFYNIKYRQSKYMQWFEIIYKEGKVTIGTNCYLYR